MLRGERNAASRRHGASRPRPFPGDSQAKVGADPAGARVARPVSPIAAPGQPGHEDGATTRVRTHVRDRAPPGSGAGQIDCSDATGKAAWRTEGRLEVLGRGACCGGMPMSRPERRFRLPPGSLRPGCTASCRTRQPDPPQPGRQRRCGIYGLGRGVRILSINDSRTLWPGRLSRPYSFAWPTGGAEFAVLLVVADTAVGPEERHSLSEQLVRSGCRYAVCFGPTSSEGMTASTW